MSQLPILFSTEREADPGLARGTTADKMTANDEHRELPAVVCVRVHDVTRRRSEVPARVRRRLPMRAMTTAT